MNMGNKGSRAQSAMEYLMTYGWAILIIAVVLAVLFSLNVFNAGASLGTACIGQPGYSCSAITLNSKGLLSFTLGQGTGVTVNNAIFSCVASANTVSPPYFAYNVITLTGTATGSWGAPGTPAAFLVAGSQSANIPNSQQLSITGVGCWPAGTGVQGSGNAWSTIGGSFTGSIWMGYSTASQPAAVTNYVQIATLNVKSSS
jgi:hypothetical protein